MMRFAPYGPQDFLNRLIDSLVARERAERRPDIPHAVFPPDRQEAVKSSLIEAATIICNEISHSMPTLEPVDASKQVFNWCVHR